ncbi:MAG: ABC transporter permease subunit [Thermoplasmata archaeon]
MRLWKSWIVAKKDLAILRKRKSLITLIVALPLAIGIGLPVLTDYLIIRKHISGSFVAELLSSFAFFFMIISAVLPLYLSSYSIVGEKIEKSLEPLLATPTSDGEILMGKYISAFLPMILSIYVGTIVFMALSDLLTYNKLGYLFYPNWAFAVVMFIGVPLSIIYGVSFGVFVSAKVNSAQTAYQMGAASLIPFYVLYVMGEINLVSLTSTTNLLIISAGLLIAVIVLYFLSKTTFNREKILTEWK